MHEPGLHTIYDGPEGGPHRVEPEIDVVAVHGLNFKNNPNHAQATWYSRGALWIRDFLPSGLQRPCRVLLFAYNSSPAIGAAAMSVDDHAKTLLQCLGEKREKTSQRPLVFICHSLGGIVVKSALVEATLNRKYESIIHSARLLVFFATPHQGGNYSEIGDIAARIVRMSLRTPGNDLLDGLKRGSRDVTRRFEQARHLLKRCLVVSFYETENYGKLGLIVDMKSAVLHLPEDREKQVALNANHSTVCKFPTAESCEPVLRIISAELERALEMQRALEPGTENAHWLVPRSVSALFTGYDEIVKQIVDAIQPDTESIHQKIFVLTGIGGQGKSEVCLNVVHQVRTQFWGVFWVDVGSKATAASGFSKIARMLGSNATDIDEILILLSNCDVTHNWLLVLDNADDLDIDYQQYLPSGSCGAVLITSRLPDWRRYSTVGLEELDSLSEDECVNLLFKTVGVPERSRLEYTSDAVAIARELGFHTLALLHAGAYIASHNCSMAEYPAKFRRQRDRLLKFDLSQSQSRYRNVFATFEASVQVLESSGSEDASDALGLLDLLSTLHYEDIPLALFTDSCHGAKLARQNAIGDQTINHLCGWHASQLPGFLAAQEVTLDHSRFFSAVARLCRSALVKQSHVRGVNVLSLHPLIHSWIATRQQGTQRQACLQSSSCMVALWEYANTEWKAYRDRLGPHVSFLLSAPSFFDDAMASAHATQTFFQIGNLLYVLRHNRELEPLLNRMFRYFDASPDVPKDGLWQLQYLASLNQSGLGNIQRSIDIINTVLESSADIRDLSRLTMEETLGGAYVANGQTKKAITLFEEMERVQTSHLGEDDESRLSLKYRLGVAYRIDHQTKKAIAIMEEVARIQSRTLEEGHITRVATAYELGSNYLDDGRVKDAIRLFSETIKEQEKYLPERHPSWISLHSGLGQAFLANGQTQKAIEILEEVNRLEALYHNQDHPSRLVGLGTLGTAYMKNGQTKAAIAIFEESLRICKSEENNRNRLAVQRELGCAYLADGKTRAALELLEGIRSIQESTLDEGHPSRVTVLIELGRAYGEAGQLDKGIELLEKTVWMQQLNLDEGHPNRLGAQNRLGLAYLDNGQTDQAIALFEEIARIQEITLDESHPSQATTKHALGMAYLDDGRIKEAIGLLEEAVETRLPTLAENHPDLLSSRHDLGRGYFSNGQTKKAMVLFEDVVKIQMTSLDADHPDQLCSKCMLGLAYLENGQKTEAMDILEEVVKIEQATLDESHPRLLTSRDRLARGHLANGRPEEAIKLLEDVVKIQSSTLAANHPKMLQSKEHLGSAYLSHERIGDAVAILEDVVTAYSGTRPDHHRLMARHTLGVAYLKDGRERKGMLILEEVVRDGAYLDEDHPDRLASQHELGYYYLSAGKIQDAIRVLEEVVRVERLTEKNDSSRLPSLRYLGIAYQVDDQMKQAIKILEEVASTSKKSFGISDPLFLTSECDLAVAYLDDGQRRKGVSMLRDVLEMQRQFLDESHEVRLKTQLQMALACLDMGRAKKAISLLEELADITQRHRDAKFPSWTNLQQELAKAHKADKKIWSRMLLRFFRTLGA